MFEKKHVNISHDDQHTVNEHIWCTRPVGENRNFEILKFRQCDAWACRYSKKWAQEQNLVLTVYIYVYIQYINFFFVSNLKTLIKNDWFSSVQVKNEDKPINLSFNNDDICTRDNPIISSQPDYYG